MKKTILLSFILSVFLSFSLKASESCHHSLLELSGQKLLRNWLSEDRLRTKTSFMEEVSTEDDLKIYRRISNEFWRQLNKKQSTALRRFTSKGLTFHTINDTMEMNLRAEEEDPDAKKSSNYYSRLGHDLRSTFEKAPLLPEGLILFRGENLEWSENGLKLPRKGQVFKSYRFYSTSLDPEIARHFATYPDLEYSIVYVIKIGEGGIPAIPTGNSKETELILPPMTNFKVLRKVSRSNFKIIFLETIK